MEYTAIGHTINFATSLQVMAGRGETLVGEGTLYRIKNLVKAVDIGRLVGTDEEDQPEIIYRIDRIKGVFNVRGIFEPAKD